MRRFARQWAASSDAVLIDLPPPATQVEPARWEGPLHGAGVDAALDFVPAVSPRLNRPDHLRPLVQLFVEAEEVGSVFATASVPPRHWKTETLLHQAVRLIARHPDWTIGYVTYEASVAYSKSRQARDLARTLGLALRTSAAREWRTTAGGGMLATGVGGPLTAHGLNVLIFDDPHKNREAAESAVQRERVHGWLRSVGLTRLTPTGSCIVNHARWHDDDAIGRLLRDRDFTWRDCNLPAVDPATGAALCPSMWPRDALDRRRRVVGEYDWASLFLGAPRPRGGRLFREPARYVMPDVVDAIVVIGCDPAATEDAAADHSAAVVLASKGRGPDQQCYVLDVWRDQVEVAKAVARLAMLQDHWGAPVYVEASGGFKAVPQALRAIHPAGADGLPDRSRGRLRVVELPPRGDKFTRALPAAAAWNDGRVRVPMSAPWLVPFLDEVLTFTGVKDVADDQVDALAHAFNAACSYVGAQPRGAVRVRGA